jgi:hypothetical protein
VASGYKPVNPAIDPIQKSAAFTSSLHMITDAKGVRDRLEVVTREAETRNTELKRRIAELEATVGQQQGGRGSDVIVEGDINLKIGDNKASRVVRHNATYGAVLSVFQAVCGPSATYIGCKTPSGRYAWVRNDFDVKFMFTIYVAAKLDGLELVSLPPDLVAPLEKLNLRKEHAHRFGMPVFLVESTGPEGALVWLSFPPTQTFDAASQTLKQVFPEFTGEISFTDDSNDSVLVDSAETWEYALAVAARLAPVGRFPLLVVRTS